MVIYFSGTGNSRFAAQLLARQLGDELLDAGRYIKAGEWSELSSSRPWVFVAPVYGWQIPHVLTRYIRQSEFSGSRDAYFVLTCGSDIGAAGEHAAALCREKGLNYRGVLELVMPENYIAMFSVPEREQALAIVEKAEPVIEQGGECIARGESFPRYDAGALGGLKSGLVNRAFYKLFVKDKAFYTTDACTGCGECERLCQLDNIRLEKGRPVWNGSCTHCMACICACPARAVEYGRKSRGKPRYRCPKELNL